AARFESDDFLNDLVGRVEVFVFDVEDRIDKMVAHEWADSILPAPAGKERALAGGGLPIEIKFGGPPCLSSVHKFSPGAQEVAAAFWRAGRRFKGDLKLARLFEVVIIYDEVGVLSASRGDGPAGDEEQAHQDAKRHSHSEAHSGLTRLNTRP